MVGELIPGVTKCSDLLGDPCIGHQCKKFMHITGKRPDSEQIVDTYYCSDVALVWMVQELAQRVNQLCAEINVTRNDLHGNVKSIGAQIANSINKMTEMFIQNQVESSKLLANSRQMLISHRGNGKEENDGYRNP